MMALYKIVTGFVYVLVYPYGWQRARSGRELWRGRLGLIPSVGPRDVWIHAASVGEAKIAGFLISHLKKKNQALSLHLSVMTEAGFRTAVRELDPDVTVSYFPLDAVRPIARTLDMIQPKMIVITETEIWPNLIRAATGRGIPVILVNARMSPKAFRRYRMMKGAMADLLAAYDRFFVKTDSDYERYTYFGVQSEKSVVAGDMKFDAPLLERSEGRRKEIRARAGVSDDQFLLVAGSTRPGEEEKLVEVYAAIKAEQPQLRLILAPRHVERTGEIRAFLDSRNLPYYIYGKAAKDDGLILVDRIGLLADIYMAADLAFVGGTLVDLGGHNLLEPVWAGAPVLFGPYVSNVREAADYITEHQYGTVVSSIDELQEILVAILEGQRSFEIKTAADMGVSATALAGDYILKRLRHV